MTTLSIETVPWEHYIFEDFLNQDQIDMLDEISEWYPVCTEEKKRIRIHFGSLFSYSKEIVQSSDNLWMRKILSKLVKDNIYQFSVFKDLIPLYVQTEYQSLGKNFNWKVHTDAYSKHFSLVLYWKPRQWVSCGTRLYDENKKFVKEIPWKFNRAVGFWNKDTYFHDFYSNVDERITFNFVFAEPKFSPKKPW